jgi:hypothetical protein
MTLPAYFLGFVYALLLGSLFHVWRDGGVGRLLLYLVLSLAGAALGQWLGTLLNWSVLTVGALNLGLITLGSLLFLVTGYWLSLVEIRSTGTEKRKV